MKPIKLQEENLRAIQNLIGLPENEFAAMVQSGLPKIKEFFNATLESLTKEQATQLAKDKGVSVNENQDSLNDFDADFKNTILKQQNEELKSKLNRQASIISQMLATIQVALEEDDLDEALNLVKEYQPDQAKDDMP